MENEKTKNWSMRPLHLVILSLFVSCEFVENIERKSRMINNFEKTALQYAKENRELKAVISKLEYRVKALETENHFLKIKLENKEGKEDILSHNEEISRSLASSLPAKGRLPGPSEEEDVVKFHIYKWKPEQLLTMAATSFEKRDYEKAAQFFHSYIINFPQHERLDDHILFQAGLSAYKSQRHYSWAEKHLQTLITRYPTSAYFRSSKLWLALSWYKQGQHKDFFKTVEEFRLKYRNTPEWKILSAHYEELAHKFKKK